MTALLRVLPLASFLFALPAHAQSAEEAPTSEAAPAPAAAEPAPAVAAQPAVPLAAPRPAPTPMPVSRAELPPDDNEGTSIHEHEEWYGWQTLTTDAASVTFLVGFGVASGRNNDSTAAVFATACAGAYFLGGPIVHAAHDNWGKAAGSLGLRVGAPFAGALLGLVLASAGDGGNDMAGAMSAVGAMLGIATAVTVDAAVLGYETVHDEPVVMPAAGTGKNGTWVGVSGRF